MEKESTSANLLKQGKGMSQSDESRWKRGAETMCFFLCSEAFEPVRQSLKDSGYRILTQYPVPSSEDFAPLIQLHGLSQIEFTEEYEGQVLYYVHSQSPWPLVLTYKAINVHYHNYLCLLAEATE